MPFCFFVLVHQTYTIIDTVSQIQIFSCLVFLQLCCMKKCTDTVIENCTYNQLCCGLFISQLAIKSPRTGWKNICISAHSKRV